jgi:hypothetical protein
MEGCRVIRVKDKGGSSEKSVSSLLDPQPPRPPNHELSASTLLLSPMMVGWIGKYRNYYN